MIKTFPLLFILLWSSAFISGDIIVQNASPFAALAFRFGIVTIGFFLFALFKKEIIFNRMGLKRSFSKVLSTIFHSI